MRFRRYTSICALLLVTALSATAPSLSAQSAAPPAQHRATSTPYSGDLSIFETPGRDERLHINRVMDILSVAPGKTVADIGAGSGWFTVRAAKRVTNSGMVYAVDINPEAIDYIDNRVQKAGLHNVKTVLSKPDNPQLPRDTIDAVLLLKTYHEVAEPVTLLRNLRSSLRPGARVGIIDRDGNGEDHGVHKQVVLREAEQAGYHLLEEHDDLVKDDKVDYFLVLAIK
ncbi:MAG: class I SAM-dependent methyltransferase [Candidatus Korobacteraceae bacterium]